MYRYFSILVFSILIGCNDGSFEIPSFEFSETVHTCGNYVLYRTNNDQTEAFILHLSDTDISNEETASPIEIPISETNVQYRIFDGVLSDSYFCADIPPASPTVSRNWTGMAGTDNKILVETIKAYNNDNELIGYKHLISLQNLVLESNGETQIFETYFFGSFITNL